MIELNTVSRSFEGKAGAAVTAVREISLSIAEGEFVCITGPSGSGKSTLMSILGCLDRGFSGSYRLAGREIQHLHPDGLAFLRRKIFGFIFQENNLLDSATAMTNVELPGAYARAPRRIRTNRARELLSGLGLEDRADHLPAELSGGEQQRVAIARALMNGGRVILADEPTGALDRDSGKKVLNTLQELADRGHTVVIVSHNPEIAALARRRIQLRNGRIEHDSGTADVRAQPADSAFAVESATGSFMANIREAVRESWAFLRANLKRGARLRVVLPAACVSIAVCLGAMTLSVGEGVYRQTFAVVNAMGMDTIDVWWATSATPLSASGQAAIQEKLTMDDVRAIEQEVTNVRAVSPTLWRRDIQVSRGDVNLRMNLKAYVDLGEKEDRGHLAGYRMQAGDFITEQEDANLDRVVVLGATARDRLFAPDINPLAQEILIENVPFRIKGVLKYRTGLVSNPTSEEDRRNSEDGINGWIYLPYKTAAAHFGTNEVDTLFVFVEDPGKISETAPSIRDLGIRRHGGDVFFVWYPSAVLEEVKLWVRKLRLVLGSIAGIALIAGNASVLAVMLMSVRARSREIGIRLAVGARRTDILRQFMSEAMTLSTVGGLFGAILGMAFVAMLRWGTNLPAEYSFWYLFFPFCCALFVGLLFSVAPARRGARLDPTTALAAA